MFGRQTRSAYDRSFKVNVYVRCTRETFTLDGITGDLPVSKFKEHLETVSGIPASCVTLYYLDLCDLVDSHNISYYHVLPGAKIYASVLEAYRHLVAASCEGKLKELKGLLPLHLTRDCISTDDVKRISMCLFITCQRGYADIVEVLLRTGINSRQKLPSGKDALFIAVEAGHLKCVELLLRRKVRPYEWNNERPSLRNWELQDRIFHAIERMKTLVKATKENQYTRLTFSQMFDSSLPTWLLGSLQRKYLCTLLSGDVHVSANNLQVFKP